MSYLIDRIIDKTLLVLSSLLTICGCNGFISNPRLTLLFATCFMGLCAYILYRKAYR